MAWKVFTIKKLVPMTPSVKLPNGSDALPYVSRTSHSHHQAQARPLESPPNTSGDLSTSALLIIAVTFFSPPCQLFSFLIDSCRSRTKCVGSSIILAQLVTPRLSVYSSKLRVLQSPFSTQCSAAFCSVIEPRVWVEDRSVCASLPIEDRSAFWSMA